MSLIEISTWKTSTRFLSQEPWRNRWLVDAPFQADNPQVLQLCDTIVRLERAVHLNHVLYKQATAIDWNNPGDGEGKKAQVFIPTGEYSIGMQPTVGDIAPDNFALYVRKDVERGYLGRWFFYGCLHLTDYDTSQSGSLILRNAPLFTHLMDNWLAALYDAHLAVLKVPQGQARYGSAYDYVNVNLCQALTVSMKNASPRKQAVSQGNGTAVIESLNEQANLFGKWRATFRDWLAFNHDFVPVDAKDGSVSILSDAYGAIKQAGNYAENQDSSTGQAGAEPVFRWAPDANAIIGISDAAKEAKTDDVKDISEKVPYTFADGVEYLTHETAGEIYDILTKWEGWLSELIRADWLNPANSQVGKTST